MAVYTIDRSKGEAHLLVQHHYQYETRTSLSPREILKNNPRVIADLAELEMLNSEILLNYPEFQTARGPIDLLLINSNADILIIETKLLRNPESTRTVVAQAIDYIKALSNETMEEFRRKLSGKAPEFLEKITQDERYASLILKNIKTGNFKVAIVGDSIHPNVLAMIESIQSAPHLSFTLFLVELRTAELDDNNLILIPRIISSTVEVERSVIKIEVNTISGKTTITSESPENNRPGSKPIITWDQYLESISIPMVRHKISDFRKEWIKQIDNLINMGTVGFSAGVNFGGRRIPIQFVYDNRINLFSESMRTVYNIPDDLYNEYLNNLKSSSFLHDKYISSNHISVPFDQLDENSLDVILESAIKLAKRLKTLGR